MDKQPARRFQILWLASVLYPFEHWFAIIRKPCKRTGRAVAAGESRERKVRTLQGSEPANGGAPGRSEMTAGRRQVQQKVNQPLTGDG